MNKHRGKLVENFVRKTGINISDLARSLSVDRRTIYNWFKQEQLSEPVIYRIAVTLNYDFAEEFPGLFAAEDLKQRTQAKQPTDHREDEKWKDKYIDLLIKYTHLLENTGANATSDPKIKHLGGR
ncbi:hypothetical protein GCM10023149_22890 [Mucilaginibacter gynuensis]|uniref:HTH cro/C1-type domain-containing protein n=1 Tax=Mucilaginibacter gynuensis TaxID=1302236 RepID=A0ABP8GDW4_9SPHI